MEEDVLGPRAAAVGSPYATCAECGTLLSRDAARREGAGLTDDTRSEWVELCPACEALNRQGERPITPEA